MSRHIMTLAVLALLAAPAVGQIGSARSERDLGNLYITGQVSGGFSFRRPSPYAGINELSLRLPSEMMDNFRRDSVGLNSLQGGRRYRPQAYTPASRATYMLRAAIRQPTGAAAAAGVVHAVLPIPGPATGLTPTPSPAFSPVLTRRQMAGILSRTEPVTPMVLSAAALSVVVPMAGERPGVSALFGMMQETQRRKLAEEMLETEAPADEADAEPLPADEVEGEGAERRLSGEDVFADMLIGLTDVPETPAMDPTTPTTRVPSGSLERLDVDPTDRTSAQRSATSLAGKLGSRTVLRKLGGHGADRFNRLMVRGDRLLAAGRFYQAAARYENARILLEFNPLPAIGAGLAYLGAGESYRASYYLRLSVRMFPDLIAVRTDIDSLLGKQIVDQRLVDLAGQLTDDESPGNMPVLFLLTFIHANRGQTDEARAYAKRLAPLVELNPRLRAYAHYFIGPETPTTSPAEP